MAEWFFGNALALLIALGIDAIFGEPDWIWKRVPHPVVGMGKLIGRLDERLNREEVSSAERRAKGRAALAQLLLLTGVPVAALWWLAHAIHPVLGMGFSALVAAILLAQRSLYDHVNAVRIPLENQDLPKARKALSMVVGRKTDHLDESGIARAALESLAENHSDGVIAPAFWMLISGPFGITLYKAINTADSMIGYRTERHRDFGRAAAKVDDMANWVPARLSPALVALGVLLGRLVRAGRRLSLPNVSTLRRDAPTHASPNAGWPEAAYASALGIALGGPRSYESGTVDAPFINGSGRQDLVAEDVARGLRLFTLTCVGTGLCVAFLVLLLT